MRGENQGENSGENEGENNPAWAEMDVGECFSVLNFYHMMQKFKTWACKVNRVLISFLTRKGNKEW